MNIRTKLAALVIAAPLAGYVAGSATVALAASDASHSRTVPTWATTPCETEDSVDCAWNARTQGNGHGHSFIVRELPGRAHMVCVFYTAPRYARHHDYCA